ncbi:hypothetical protein T12_12015 [Trichinella patagoniensis]|uniref:Uncharacterized protein n=1 Tax=Trichinella patagoniensis TaxID=990121 RepID=A0A0V1A763_9BILA|nr:hypothetical protein T12_12015 [Trichinella patagoniensis]
MNSEGKNKETMNKHAYLLSSAIAWVVRNFYDATDALSNQRKQNNGSKSMAANEKQIYPLCLPTRAYTGLEQRRIMHICRRENLNRILMNCVFLLILGSAISYMFYWSLILVDFSIVLKSPLPTYVM